MLAKQLEEAKAKLAAAPTGGPLVPPAAPAMNVQAVMSFMRAFAATLSQDAGGAFGTALDHIEQIFSSQEVPLPAPAGPPPGRAGDGAADPSADSALSLALVLSLVGESGNRHGTKILLTRLQSIPRKPAKIGGKMVFLPSVSPPALVTIHLGEARARL